MKKRLTDTVCRLFLLIGLAILIMYGGSGSAIGADTRCSAPNDAVTAYFDVIASAPAELKEAIRQFPKGADIHNHLSGTVMPEDYITMGIANDDCYGSDPRDPTMFAIAAKAGTSAACPPGSSPLSQAGPADRQKLVKSLSMYRFGYPDIQSGHDQFFATFGRFGAVSGSKSGNTSLMLAKLLQQADRDTVSYVETTMSFQSKAVGNLADLLRSKYAGPSYYTGTSHYKEMYEFLMDSGLKDAVAAARKDVAAYMAGTKGILRCGAPDQDHACLVSYAFIVCTNRNSSQGGKADLPSLFTQVAFSFVLADMENNVVGVNLVSGEDNPVSMQSFPTVMQFFTFFNTFFPNVNIALHAGEITPCFVGTGNPALKDHLTGSINAGAKRIGHAISFAYLNGNDQNDVISLMKNKNVLIEAPFTSNAQILGVAGDSHPFVLYVWKYGVPTAFATDDEGVSHATYSDEWVYAYRQYVPFQYNAMVQLARYSLQYSFAPGASLWEDIPKAKIVRQCAGVPPGISDPPQACKSFLATSEKASRQWSYEAALSNYTIKYGRYLKESKIRAQH